MHSPVQLFASLVIVCFVSVAALQVSSDDLVLTDGALNAAQYVGEQIINELITAVRGFNVTRKFKQSGLDGSVNLHDVNIQLTQIPDVSGQFKSASDITLELESLGFAIDGKFLGNAGWFSMNGDVHGDVKNMKVIVKSIVDRMADGKMVVKMDKCRTEVGSTKFTINAEGMLGTFAKNFEGPLNKEISAKMPGMMCQGLQHIIEKRGPALFARLLQAPIEKAFKRTEKTEALLKKLKQ